MKKWWFEGLFTFIMFLFSVSVSIAGDYKLIEDKELETMVADGKPIVIVDVREPYEFAEGHIKGAINIPYESAKKRALKELSTNDRIVFVCHGGPMGDELGVLLVKNGYKDVYNLKGGMKKWKGAVVK